MVLRLKINSRPKNNTFSRHDKEFGRKTMFAERNEDGINVIPMSAFETDHVGY